MAVTRSRRKNRTLKKRWRHLASTSSKGKLNKTPKKRWKHLASNIKKEKSINQFIVKSKQSLVRRISAVIICLILWLYMLIVADFFISACFNYNDNFIRLFKIYFKVTNNDIIQFVAISVSYFCLSFLILFSWKMYNKKRFGSLNRRKKPDDTTDEEMLSLCLIQPKDYIVLQTEKIITFNENPVSELSRRK